jgi:hypothetical protein
MLLLLHHILLVRLSLLHLLQLLLLLLPCLLHQETGSVLCLTAAAERCAVQHQQAHLLLLLLLLLLLCLHLHHLQALQEPESSKTMTQ